MFFLVRSFHAFLLDASFLFFLAIKQNVLTFFIYIYIASSEPLSDLYVSPLILSMRDLFTHSMLGPCTFPSLNTVPYVFFNLQIIVYVTSRKRTQTCY